MNGALTEDDVLRLLDRWAAAQPPSAEPMTGTVVGVPDTSRYMLVSGVGGATIPIPVWRPMSADPYAPGDRIGLTRGDEGYLIAGPILDRDPAIIEVPDPAEALTLATLQLLGVATQEGLDEHIDSELHLHTYWTPNTLGTDDGNWSQIGQGSIDERFGSVAAQFFLNGQGSNGDTWTRGQVRFRVRQQDDYGSDPSVVLELLDAGDITGDDISLVVTDNAGPTLFAVYVRVTRQYEWVEWTPTWIRRDRCDFAWTGCQAFIAALP